MAQDPPVAGRPGDSRAVIIGCGDLAINAAHLIGRRHDLLLTDIDPARLQAARNQLETEGIIVDAVQTDIADPASVARLAAHAEPGPPIAAIAHVAALAPSAGDWRRLMEVNLIGPHLVARHIGPLIEPGGVAVFVASLAGHVMDVSADLRTVLRDPLQPDFMARLEQADATPITATLAYVYSKAALIEFCETLAVAWGPRHVRAISVSPGLIQSEMGRRERQHNPATTRMSDDTPLRREGTVAEAVAVIDFAASPQASFLNGTDILVDGGLMAAARAAKRAKPGA
jgi:NAD(P)-dependent dehydrogenase (short-subunit alcohol dehydrogenase family)